MGLSCRLEPPLLKQLRVIVFSDISHEQKPQVSIRTFPQSKKQQTFHCEPGVPHFEGQLASMNFTTALRISNCQGSLASLLRLHCRLPSEGTRNRVHCSSPSQNFISKSIRPRLSKNKKMSLLFLSSLLLLRYLGLCREAMIWCESEMAIFFISRICSKWRHLNIFVQFHRKF